jgi:hypothetical protein
MTLNPARLRTCGSFPGGAVSPLGYLRWLISNADQNGFRGCMVRVSGRVFVDPEAVTAWIAEQQVNPLPHNRGIARKRLAKPGGSCHGIGNV